MPKHQTWCKNSPVVSFLHPGQERKHPKTFDHLSDFCTNQYNCIKTVYIIKAPWSRHVEKLCKKLTLIVCFESTIRIYLSLTPCYPPASKVSGESANLTERKNIPMFMVSKNLWLHCLCVFLSVCLWRNKRLFTLIFLWGVYNRTLSINPPEKTFNL